MMNVETSRISVQIADVMFRDNLRIAVVFVLKGSHMYDIYEGLDFALIKFY